MQDRSDVKAYYIVVFYMARLTQNLLHLLHYREPRWSLPVCKCQLPCRICHCSYSTILRTSGSNMVFYFNRQQEKRKGSQGLDRLPQVYLQPVDSLPR